MEYSKYKEELKQKLWAAVDELQQSDGFVLVATEDDVSFTPLKAAGWDEHVLELEPLEYATLRQYNERLRQSSDELERKVKTMQGQITDRTKRLEEITRAIEVATGRTEPPQG